jgi:hypothetical protein
VYVLDGELAIDNNASENALRRIALGRNYAQFTIMRRQAIIDVGR